MVCNRWQSWGGWICILSASALLGAEPETGKKPASSEVEPQFLSNIRQVTNGFAKAGEGYFSPNGKRIIYQAIKPDYPFYQIYVQDLEEGHPRMVSTGKGRTTCSYFSPDGERILFASSHLDPQVEKTAADARKQEEEDKKAGVRRNYKWDFDPHMDMFEADLSGKILRRLTDTPGYDAEGAWSKDGSKIAFCSQRNGDLDLYVMDADGKNVRQLTNSPGYDGGPFISPDSKWVLYRSDRKEKDRLQLHVIGIDGKGDTALTDNVGVNWGPYWHPTEPYIIWSGADHTDPKARPNYDLWLMRYKVEDGKFQGGKPIRVTDFAGADVLPVFSPDGTKLLWTSTRTADHSSQLFIADFKLPK